MSLMASSADETILLIAGRAVVAARVEEKLALHREFYNRTLSR
jgi:hypothetical protein